MQDSIYLTWSINSDLFISGSIQNRNSDDTIEFWKDISGFLILAYRLIQQDILGKNQANNINICVNKLNLN